jgi:hypothetical protein
MVHNDVCLECVPTTLRLSLVQNASHVTEYIDCICTCILLIQMELKLRSGSSSTENSQKKKKSDYNERRRTLGKNKSHVLCTE